MSPAPEATGFNLWWVCRSNHRRTAWRMDEFFREMMRFLFEGDRVLTMGGWFMFFWSEWRREASAVRWADRLSEVSKAAAAAHLASAQTMEGIRENLRLIVSRST